MRSADQEAVELANKDWAEQRARVLVHGEMLSRVPIIDETGLYLGSSWQSPAFVVVYNRRVRDLLSATGLPDWAPGARNIRTHEIDRVLAMAQPIDVHRLESKPERNLVRRHCRFWRETLGATPTSILLIPERKIIVLVGTVAGQVRLDVLDTIEMHWMSTFSVASISPANQSLT